MAGNPFHGTHGTVFTLKRYALNRRSSGSWLRAASHDGEATSGADYEEPSDGEIPEDIPDQAAEAAPIPFSSLTEEVETPDPMIRAGLAARAFINAGPGTGKTYIVVQRIIYLLENKLAEPEDIFGALLYPSRRSGDPGARSRSGARWKDCHGVGRTAGECAHV